MKHLKKISFAFLITIISISMLSFDSNQQSPFHTKLFTYCNSLPLEFNQIPQERKIELEEISTYVLAQQKEKKAINLIFVCTSNSRRSHMAQVWSQVASVYYGVENVSTFSGGTEQTRVNINAIKAFENTGIVLQSNKQSDNPIWLASIGEKLNPMVLFSKKYTDSTNPSQNFGAIMVCSEADKSCPYVEGANFRLGLPFQDPKAFDNTPQQSEKYNERCRQIAREMFYVFSKVGTAKFK